jgi:hypothetical protein
VKIVVEEVGGTPQKAVIPRAMPEADGVCDVCACDADSLTLETEEGRIRVYYDERPPVWLDYA